MATVASPTSSGIAETVAPVANPAPLGLIGFGMTTLLLGAINAGFITAAPGTPTAGSAAVVLALAVAFGGAGQILAGMWEFRVGNTFGATAFTSYGLFWISFVLINTTFAPLLPKDPTPILGLYALAWGIFTAYMFIASLGGASRGVSLVFFLLALTFITLAIAFWAKSLPSAGWNQISGILALLTAVAAIYCSFAFVTNANFKRTVLPV
jgi:succinate-acetate transporter protein